MNPTVPSPNQPASNHGSSVVIAVALVARQGFKAGTGGTRKPPGMTVGLSALRLPLVLMLVLALLTGPAGLGPGPATVRAQDALPGADLTVTELMERARQAFAAEDWGLAAGLIQRFLDEYGTAEEVAEAVTAFRPLLAVALLRLNRFAEAMPAVDLALESPGLALPVRDELTFWRGIGFLQTGQTAEARLAFGEYYANESFNASRRHEAAILYGTCYLLEEDTGGAADFFAAQLPVLWSQNPEAAGRGAVLLLHSQLQAGRHDEALQLVRDTFPRLRDMTQLIAFQTLCLQLGSAMLDQQRYYDAIVCLQRVLPRQRLLDRQRQRLQWVREQLEQVGDRPQLAHLRFQYQNLQTKIAREVESFETIEHFDSALRLRLATAYMGLERYLQAALILDDMLATMEPDPVVDQATLALMQCWSETGRWDRVVQAADTWLDKFDARDNERAPQVLFLRASALRDLDELVLAEAEFGRIVDAFPEHEIAAPSLFLLGICQLEQDLNPDAMRVFQELQQKYPDHPQAEDAFYWEGMALSFMREHEAAREHMERYLERHAESPKYRAEATFRIAYSTQALADYPLADRQLGAFIEQFPMSALADEARLLRGDALGAMGEVDQAIEVWSSIDPASTRFFEEGWFKAGDALKLLERFEVMRAHFEQFIADYPRSRRLAEAVYWIGWSWQAEDQSGETLRIYWDTIEEFGDQPENHGVEDILLALRNLYPGEDGRRRLATMLAELHEQAIEDGRDTLAVRSQWARGHVLAADSELGRDAAFLRAAQRVDAKIHNPLMTIDCAESMVAAGQLNDAEELFTELRRWHPRSLHKDRAFLGLAGIAVRRQEYDQALAWLDRFETEVTASARGGEMVLMRADILERSGRAELARAELERLLEMGEAPAELRARTLLRLGDALAAGGEEMQAIVYYERVYITYGRFRDVVAEAYWKRGQLLEQLDRRDEAIEVYRELALRADLAGQPPSRLAIERLEEIAPGWRTRPQPADEPAAGTTAGT